jgi:hypothetical protein
MRKQGEGPHPLPPLPAGRGEAAWQAVCGRLLGTHSVAEAVGGKTTGWAGRASARPYYEAQVAGCGIVSLRHDMDSPASRAKLGLSVA